MPRKGRSNDFFRICEQARRDPAWYFLELKASETGILSADELADAQRSMTPEQYAQEYECSFDAAILGAYYAKQIAQLRSQGRITSVPHDPNYPVYTSWDLGIHDLTCIWFCQIVGREVRWLDYEESFSRSLIDSAKVTLTKPYLYAEHYMPHDIDTREMTSAKTRKETLEGVGLRPIRPGSRLGSAERINALRQLLPRSVFDEAKCAKGLEALINYQVAYDQKNRTPLDHPKHDWSSHASDAAGEMAVQLYDVKAAMNQRRAIVTADYDPLRIGTPGYAQELARHEAQDGPFDERPWMRKETSGMDWDPFKA